MTVPEFPTKDRALIKRGMTHVSYDRFCEVSDKYKDADEAVALKELCLYIGVGTWCLRDYAKRAGIGISILTDTDGVYWVVFYTKKETPKNE